MVHQANIQRTTRIDTILRNIPAKQNPLYFTQKSGIGTEMRLVPGNISGFNSKLFQRFNDKIKIRALKNTWGRGFKCKSNAFLVTP